MLLLLICVLYLGISMGIYMQASIIGGFGRAKKFAFVVPLLLPILLLWCALKENDITYLKLFLVYDTIAIVLLKGISRFITCSTQNTRQECELQAAKWELQTEEFEFPTTKKVNRIWKAAIGAMCMMAFH